MSDTQIVSHNSYKSIQFLERKRCCGLRNTSLRIIALIQEIESLSNFQKISLINRYISIMEDFQGRTITYSILFHIGYIKWFQLEESI